ncbi:MAG: biopolymer transporter ExbD [Planctomyces sp.]|nr:biopolymer transporter ExbD [Planctomyces sp.]
MRVPSQFTSQPSIKFNLTPLIDVVFLLIIFFLVASHFVRNEHAEAVSLPFSFQGRDDHDAAPHRLTVTVRKDGALFVGSEPLTAEQIGDRIARLKSDAKTAGSLPEVRIRSDRLTLYEHVRHLVEECAAQEITRIQFPVEVQP